MSPSTYDDVVDLAVPFSGDALGNHGQLGDQEQKDDGSGSADPLASFPTVDDSDIEDTVNVGHDEVGAGRSTVLERMRARLQNPPAGPFDREDVTWRKELHSGRGGHVKEVHTAIIPWDRLEDFVEGEETMRDFPCTLNRRRHAEQEKAH
jgi:hypothetical protein